MNSKQILLTKQAMALLGVLLFLGGMLYLYEKYFFPHTELGKVLYYDKKKHYSKGDSINGTVSWVMHNRGTYIMYYGNDTVYTFPTTRNHDYATYNLRELLKVGDQIIKKRNTDTLWVVRGTKKYFFRLGEVINKTVKQ